MEQPMTAMELWHIYSRPDGTTTMEKVELPMTPAGGGTGSKLLNGDGVIFRYMPADLNADWHPAPRRQLVATLTGEGEIETGDGQVLIVKPGVITYLEDTTGQGHKTRARGSAGRITVFLPLDDSTTIP
jgi:hypothetical protein